MSNPLKTHLSRRTLLKSLGGLGAGVLTSSLALNLGQRALSQSAHVPLQSAFYTTKVGAMDVTVIHDGIFHFPVAAFGTNAPEGALTTLLDKHFLPTDVASVPMHLLLVRTEDKLVLIDTGMGDYTFPGDSPKSGRLLATLALLGVHPEDIDSVLLTHGHPDHIGATVTHDGKASFPNATYYLPAAELPLWTQDPNRIDDDFFSFMVQVGNNALSPLHSQLELYEGKVEIAKGVTTLEAPGHTPGHSAVMLESEGERLVNLADTAVHYVAALQEPSWALAAEMDPELAAFTRKDLLTWVSSERIKVFGYHFPFPGLGYVLNNEDGSGWHWFPTI